MKRLLPNNIAQYVEQNALRKTIFFYCRGDQFFTLRLGPFRFQNDVRPQIVEAVTFKVLMKGVVALVP